MEEEAERRGGKKVVLAYLGSSNNVEATTIIMVKQQGNNNMRKEGSHSRALIYLFLKHWVKLGLSIFIFYYFNRINEIELVYISANAWTNIYHYYHAISNGTVVHGTNMSVDVGNISTCQQQTCNSMSSLVNLFLTWRSQTRCWFSKIQSREAYDSLGLVQPSFACLNVFSIKILYVLIWSHTHHD